MTEKEKIAQIIAERICPLGKVHKLLWGAEKVCYSRDNFAECEKVSKCVDALIAAGIGDVKETEHRAEVTGRALLNACVNLIRDKEDNVNMELLARVVYTNYLRKAERDIAEERKDD